MKKLTFRRRWPCGYNPRIVGPFQSPTPARSVSPQSDQDQLDERYARALAGGYKALFLCSAIANAEANGVRRSPDSVHEWELTGIYPLLDPIIRDLPFEIVRGPGDGRIEHVAVGYDDTNAKRYALYKSGEGCSVQPIGLAVASDDEPVPAPR